MNQLLLLCGQVRRAGWKRLDANPDFQPDFLSTIPPLPTDVLAVRWDNIEWVHGITSLYPWDAKNILQTILGILAPGGVLVLEQPDAAKCDPAVNPGWLFGDPSLRNPLHMCKWTYTPESLSTLLREIGYSRIDIMPAKHHGFPDRDFRIEAFS